MEGQFFHGGQVLRGTIKRERKRDKGSDCILELIGELITKLKIGSIELMTKLKITKRKIGLSD